MLIAAFLSFPGTRCIRRQSSTTEIPCYFIMHNYTTTVPCIT